MATYIPSKPSMGERIGSALGTGIGAGLTNIAEHKLQQIQKKRDIDTRKDQLKKIGMDDTEAEFFAGQDAETQYYGARDAILRDLKDKGGDEQMMDDWFPKTPQEFQKADKLRNENIEAQEQSTAGIGQALQRPGQMGLQEALGKAPQAVPQPTLNDRLKQMVPQAKEQVPPSAKPRKSFEGINIRTPSERALEPKLALEREKAGIKETAAEKKQKSADQKEINKETKKYYDETLTQEEAAKKGDLRLNKMENLVKKGGLPISTFYNIFKNLEESVAPTHGATAGALVGGALGTVIPGLGTVLGATAGGAIGGLISPVATILKGIQRQTSPNTEQFEKLSADFVRDAKAIYGSRLTDQDLKSFLQMIPTLSNTDEGKLAIIHNMKIFNKGAEVKSRVMKKLIKENGGQRPANLPILVEERAKPELDKIAQEFEVVGQ